MRSDGTVCLTEVEMGFRFEEKRVTNLSQNWGFRLDGAMNMLLKWKYIRFDRIKFEIFVTIRDGCQYIIINIRSSQTIPMKI